MKTDRATIDHFLRMLWPDDVPEGTRLCVWTLAGRRATWCKTVDDAVSAAAASNGDTYAGGGLGLPGLQADERVKKNTVQGIPGLWADVDYSDDVHKKSPHLPPNEAAALELLDMLPHRPTLTVHSGHGLQVWWLFEEAWIFDDDDERDRAARILKGWARFMRDRAAERGWQVDSVFDLSRVMRIPGTVNAKGVPEVMARILDDKGQRYNPSDFEDWIADSADSVIASVEIADFVIDENAVPNWDKFGVAKDNDPDFLATWERKRSDMKDQSASAYDLSLATRTAALGWSDQEIVNLMIANRREHKDPPKLRADYFKMTLTKARADVHRDQAIEELEEMNAQGIEEERDGVDDGEGKKQIAEETRETILRTVNKTLIDNVQITDAIKYQQDPRASYQLRTPHGDVHDMTIEDLLSPTRFNARVADATGWISKPMKGEKWRQVAQSILRACRVIIVQGSGDSEEMEIVIESYLKDRTPKTITEDRRDVLAAALRASKPVVKDGAINLSVRDLCRWMQFNPGLQLDRATAKRIGMRMHKMGARQVKLSVRHDGRLCQGRYWALPVDQFDPEAYTDAGVNT